MVILIVSVITILILVILSSVFKIYTLIDIIVGNYKKLANSSNKINGVLLFASMIVGFISLSFYSYVEFDRYSIAVASEHGVFTDRLFVINILVTSVVFVITQFALFYFPYRYNWTASRKPSFFVEDHKLEFIWTVVPAIALTVLVFEGLKLWSNITETPPENSEVIEIVGQQFGWKARYPGNSKRLGKYDYRLIDPTNEVGLDLTDHSSFDDFLSNTLYLPKGKPVLLKIRSKDVLHSCYIPHFRVKMDAVPGMPTRFWFVPQKTTLEMRDELSNSDFDYELACAEICGKGHFTMRMLVKVENQSDYEKWFSNQNSWLSKNPEYLDQVPDNLKELALVKTGLENELYN
jgi:cytochrome c oxidase subunit 2